MSDAFLKVAAYVGAMVLSLLPFPISAIAADIGADVLEGNMPPALIAARKVLGYATLGALAFTVGKMAYHGVKAAFSYIRQHGMGILRAAMDYLSPAGLAGRALRWLKRKQSTPGACGCFTASTVVWTMAGLISIADVRTGDWVLTRDELSGEMSFQPVEAEIKIEDAALLDISLRHADGKVETIHTTDEHPLWVECSGWTRADRLKTGDLVKTLNGEARVEGLSFTATRTQVFNLSVDGNPNYYIGVDGVWVHNCALDPRTQYRKAFENLLRYPLPPNYHVHHRIPQRYRDSFHGAEDIVDSPSNWAAVPSEVHAQISGMWTSWAARNSNPSAAQIRQFADQVDSQFFGHYILPQ